MTDAAEHRSQSPAADRNVDDRRVDDDPNASQRVRLVVGCGYLGSRVAERWLRAGLDVHVLTRSAEHAAETVGQGARLRLGDVTRPETLQDLPPAATVLWAVGYDPQSNVDRAAVFLTGLSNLLDRLDRNALRRFVFLSSTGVYGEHAGDWVDEDTPCRPDRESTRILAAAEQRLSAHPLGDRAMILRLAGVYGPGRIPHSADLASGRPIRAAASGRVNLIHVDDAVTAVLAAEQGGRPPRIYNTADGQPVERREFYRTLARLQGVAPPEFLEPDPTPNRPARGRGSKRVSNERMLRELKVSLAYPSYQSGLAAIVGNRP